MERMETLPPFLLGVDVDKTVWTNSITQLEARDPNTVAVISVHPSSEEEGELEVMIESSSSTSSAEQFGVVRGRENADALFESITRESKRVRRSEELSDIFSFVSREAVEAGVWVITSRDSGCKIYVLTGKPMNTSLAGVMVKAFEDSTFNGSVFKAFSADGARILGRGGSGVAILVTDATDPKSTTREKVVLKIEAKYIVDLEDEDLATDPRKLGEVTLGMLLNKVFYEARVTPSVTRSLSMFQCKTLLPETGVWGDLMQQILVSGSIIAETVEAHSSAQFLYTEQEWADRGTVYNFSSGMSEDDDLKSMRDDSALRVEVTKSLLFQGLHALEAFRRAGFIHADITSDNVALTSVQDTENHFYFINGDGSKEEFIKAFKPLKDLMIKFIDYGSSRFRDAHPTNNPGKSHYARIPGENMYNHLTAPSFVPPEAYSRVRRGEPDNTVKDTWYLSSASDLWQFGLVMLTFALGSRPLFSGDRYRHDPPATFESNIRNILKDGVYYEIEEEGHRIAFHLWNLAKLLGLPWSRQGVKKTSSSLRDRVVEKFPIYHAFELAEKEGLVDDIMRSGGVLRISQVYKKVFGPRVLPYIYKMMAWDPDDRLTPGTIISLMSSGYFLSFSKAARNIALPDTTDISVGEYTRFIREAASRPNVKTWSVVTTDISYHVDISERIGGCVKSTTGPSRFTKLPKHIHQELVEAKFFQKESKSKSKPVGAISMKTFNDDLAKLSLDSRMEIGTRVQPKKEIQKKKEGDWSVWL